MLGVAGVRILLFGNAPNSIPFEVDNTQYMEMSRPRDSRFITSIARDYVHYAKTGYQWNDGHWEPPRAGYRWRAPRWEQAGSKWFFVIGDWEQDSPEK
jgi:hypothetical protein